MSHDHGKTCLCTSNHQPSVLEGTVHHIWPLGDGGPDIPHNLVYICPTTHYNVHELYRAMKKAGREISLYEFSKLYEVPVSRYAQLIAALGYRRFVARALVD